MSPANPTPCSLTLAGSTATFEVVLGESRAAFLPESGSLPAAARRDPQRLGTRLSAPPAAPKPAAGPDAATLAEEAASS